MLTDQITLKEHSINVTRRTFVVCCNPNSTRTFSVSWEHSFNSRWSRICASKCLWTLRRWCFNCSHSQKLHLLLRDHLMNFKDSDSLQSVSCVCSSEAQVRKSQRNDKRLHSESWEYLMIKASDSLKITTVWWDSTGSAKIFIYSPSCWSKPVRLHKRRYFEERLSVFFHMMKVNVWFPRLFKIFTSVFHLRKKVV